MYCNILLVCLPQANAHLSLDLEILAKALLHCTQVKKIAGKGPSALPLIVTEFQLPVDNYVRFYSVLDCW